METPGQEAEVLVLMRAFTVIDRAELASLNDRSGFKVEERVGKDNRGPEWDSLAFSLKGTVWVVEIWDWLMCT